VLATGDDGLRERLHAYKQGLREKVMDKSERLQAELAR